MQGKLADMYVRLNASRAYLYTIAKNATDKTMTSKDSAGVIFLDFTLKYFN